MVAVSVFLCAHVRMICIIPRQRDIYYRNLDKAVRTIGVSGPVRRTVLLEATLVNVVSKRYSSRCSSNISPKRPHVSPPRRLIISSCQNQRSFVHSTNINQLITVHSFHSRTRAVPVPPLDLASPPPPCQADHLVDETSVENEDASISMVATLK